VFLTHRSHSRGYNPRVAHPTSRWIAVLLSGALLVAALAGSLGRGSADAGPTFARSAVVDALSGTLREARLARVTATWRGGPITTSTGETVDVRVSDALPPESTPEGWAEFLTGLTHGSEISTLTAYVGTFTEIQDLCGRQALGCYTRNEMVAIGEPALGDATPEEIVRHEYGHHVAFHRLNSPWVAVEWGPKRWASAANVCARVARDEAIPGDEGTNYARNPGEAWAEVYRLMDERKAGITTASWQIVDRSFFPNEAALQAAEQDVTQPWTKQRTIRFTHVFGKRTPKVWWISLQTPLDGDLRVTATMPPGGTADVALVAGNRRTVVRRGQWVGQRIRRLEGAVCGQRSLFVRVSQAGSLGRVRVAVVAP
jgi:hypothetical protein